MRIVSVNIARNNAVGPELYRIDYGTKLQLVGAELPVAYEVHFGKNKKDDAILQIGDSTGVTVPDELLLTDGTLYGWLYVHTGADDGWTEREFTCPVRNRPGVSPDEPTPVQQGVIDQAIAALNAGVEDVQEAVEGVQDAIDTALQEAKESGEFDGEDGVSPTVAVTEITGGHQVRITDAEGTESFDVMNGVDGENGVSPTATVTQTATGAIVSITDSQGTTTVEISNGQDGAPGDPGTDGISPTITITDIPGGHRVTITDADGTHSMDVMDGVDGEDGVGVPSGGTTGQVLSKASDTDYDTEWTTPEAGGVQDVQVNGTSVVTDGVANVPMAHGDSSTATYGVVKAQSAYGISINGNDGGLRVFGASSSEIKVATGLAGLYKPIAPFRQHESTFYGLAKAAGDTTQSASSNAVGTYTESAKSKISEMLNGPVSVTGSTPTITALPGIRYVCGECTTLDITLPESGCIDVTFESGSTPTVLTVTPPTGVTVKWAGGFDPTSLEANTTYEINVCDGLGVAASWT